MHQFLEKIYFSLRREVVFVKVLPPNASEEEGLERSESAT